MVLTDEELMKAWQAGYEATNPGWGRTQREPEALRAVEAAVVERLISEAEAANRCEPGAGLDLQIAVRRDTHFIDWLRSKVKA